MLKTKEVEKALEIILACPDKSKTFLSRVRKLGFEKAYLKTVDEAFAGECMKASSENWCQCDITAPINNLFFDATGEGMNLGHDTTKSALKKRFPAARIEKLVKKLLAGKAEEKEKQS
jgi:hypothetical protein